MAPATDTSDARRGGLWFAAAGLLFPLAAVPAYALVIDVPFLRSTGLVALICLALGAALGGVALWRDRRRWVRILALADLALALGLTTAYYTLSVLPEPGDAANTLAVAPDFTLKDHHGRDVSLKNAYSAGPVLLVFYRGHW